MIDRGSLPWMVIRQDDDGGRYRVGRYATLIEAQALAERLTGRAEREAEGVEESENGRRGSGSEAGTGAGEARTVSATRVRRYVVERLDYPGGGQA